MDDLECFDIPPIPLIVRRCENRKCNAILRRGNADDLCSPCRARTEKRRRPEPEQEGEE